MTRALTDHEVDVIRRRRLAGEAVLSIAEDYGVSRSTISNALHAEKTYAHKSEGSLLKASQIKALQNGEDIGRTGLGAGRKLTAGQCNELRKMFDAGESIPMIMMRTGHSRNTIVDVLLCRGAYVGTQARPRRLDLRKRRSLDEHDVVKIKQMIADGASNHEVCRELDVSLATITAIKAGSGRFAFDAEQPTRICAPEDAAHASFADLPRHADKQRSGSLPPELIMNASLAGTIRKALQGKTIKSAYAQGMIDLFVARSTNPASMSQEADDQRLRQDLIDFLVTAKK